MIILSQDQETLEKKWPEAAAHIRAAELKHEFFSLLCIKRNGKINAWKQDRIDELKNLPAIQDYSFDHFWLYSDFDNNCEVGCDADGGVTGSKCVELPSSYVSPIIGR
ncbi:hypothetical protein LCGC14_2240220 [marine sediment metagenome]|uniref:Uncharacterized protein n=1 Tax=marine sediment metagenome TaxID=412755 RepID=A0A0F9DT91_9ZZZZ